jgi:hypothetical protein
VSSETLFLERTGQKVIQWRLLGFGCLLNGSVVGKVRCRQMEDEDLTELLMTSSLITMINFNLLIH